MPNPASVLEQQEEPRKSTMQSAALEANSSFVTQEVNRIL
jgi:predicted PhzF superfamily epimerase YddE/YHI9